jgi:hypothetical protein
VASKPPEIQRADSKQCRTRNESLGLPRPHVLRPCAYSSARTRADPGAGCFDNNRLRNVQDLINAERSEIEIGWTFLARDYWGGRYNQEMKRLLLNYAFQFVEKVVFYVGENNIRSQKAMLKSAEFQTASFNGLVRSNR